VYLPEKRVALLVADRYEDRGLFYPYYRLREAGAEPELIGERSTEYAGSFGMLVRPHRSIATASAESFDALIVPGGLAAEQIRDNRQMLAFLRQVHGRGGHVAAIGRGSAVLAAAGLVAGRRVTSPRTIRAELLAAGALWVDQEVVSDDHLITSRVPDDLPAFCRALTDSLR